MLREAKDSLVKLNLQLFADDVDNVDNADKNRKVLFGWFSRRLQTAYTKVDNVDNY